MFDEILNCKRPIRYKDVCEMLCWLTCKYDFFKKYNAGYSILGRRLEYVKIGSGNTAALIVSAHHALEWMTSQLTMKFLFDVANAYDNHQKYLGYNLDEYFKKYTLYILPMLNPDGIELVNCGFQKENEKYKKELEIATNGTFNFSDWSANVRGVDLNHNYDAGFDKARELAAARGITLYAPKMYGGKYPESESESFAAAELARKVQPDILLALHSQGEVIYHTYNGNEPCECHLIAEEFEKLSGYVPELANGLTSYSGYKDWFIDKYNKCGFTIEIGMGENPLPLAQFADNYKKFAPILINAPVLAEKYKIK